MIGQMTLGVDGCHASAAGRTHGLTVAGVTDIARREYARDTRRGGAVALENYITARVQGELAFE